MIFKPYAFMIYGLALYMSILFFGPYDYTLYSPLGALYFIVAFSLFIFSAWVFDRPLAKKPVNETNYAVVISKKAELFLIITMAASFLAFCLHMYHVFTLPIPGGYRFAADDYRDFLSVARPTWDKFAEIGLNAGVAAYLITSRLNKTHFKMTKAWGMVSLFLPAIAILAVGARSRIITSIGLFIIIAAMDRTKRAVSPPAFIRKLKKWHKGILVLTILSFAYLTMALFSARGVLAAPDQYLRYPGDMPLKPMYHMIYNATNGAIGPLYKACMYYTHSGPVFTWAFEHYKDIPMYFGGYMFYLEGYLLRLVNIPFPDYLAIAAQSPVAGLYSSFITGYFLDWGIGGTLGMIGVTGWAFGRISYFSRRKRFSYYVLPVVLFMCWVSPIYYFWHMSWEAVLLWFVLIYPMCRCLGLNRVPAPIDAKLEAYEK